MCRMDIWDTNAYFSSRVPVMASRMPLVKSAACALAAKHLHHISRREGRTYNPPPAWPFIEQMDWYLEYVKHRQDSIHQLREASSNCTSNTTPVVVETILAALAILCMCDMMDAPKEPWGSPMASLVPVQMDTGDSNGHPLLLQIAPGATKNPCFWNLAWQDLVQSCKSGIYCALGRNAIATNNPLKS